jgi:hypothetical protein
MTSSSEAVLAIATAFDACREKVREVVPDGDARNGALKALSDVERRAVRAYYAGESAS